MKRELIEKRTRNSKTHYLGGRKYAWDGVIGAIHYKDNPKDKAEQWKDIDTTISADGKVTKAPYNLHVSLGGMPGFHYKSKESGTFIVRIKVARLNKGKPDITPNISKPRVEGNKVVWENLYPDTDIVLVAENTCVSLKRILKSVKAPLEYDIDIQEVATGVAKLRPLRPAVDTNGQALVMEEEAIASGRTETLKLEPVEPEAAQPIIFPVEDSTEINEYIDASADDRHDSDDGSRHPVDATDLGVYQYIEGDPKRLHAGLRFTGLGLSQGVTIDASYITIVTYLSTYDDAQCDIYCEDQESPPNFANGSALIQDRARTANSTEWSENLIGIGSRNTPSLVSPTQEVCTDYAVDNIVFLWIGKIGAIRKDLAFHAYDRGYGIPLLHIEYTVAPPYVPRHSGSVGVLMF